MGRLGGYHRSLPSFQFPKEKTPIICSAFLDKLLFLFFWKESKLLSRIKKVRVCVMLYRRGEGFSQVL